MKEFTVEKEDWEKEKKNHDNKVYNLKVDQVVYSQEGFELAVTQRHRVRLATANDYNSRRETNV
ncbi:hypothetical protein TSUD_94750 [Trifolium subterraneum]|uniref:Uncharacterized protein n=1 Tax=Trifolium subterraneum TaxID=3900 RepID=A0A2Z6NUU0_TRISU|nr:hypothetical protein TSUD_94750 [Trifolium subterraneum]